MYIRKKSEPTLTLIKKDTMSFPEKKIFDTKQRGIYHKDFKVRYILNSSWNDFSL